MCGIAGAYFSRTDRPVDAQRLRQMTRALTHRGPDDEGYFLDGALGLGMRRLAVIDLVTGHQPMANEDGTVVVVFNGEIFNFRELREELTARGHQFRTTSDTEAIVHAYEEYGGDFPRHLNGMFAIAVWDARQRRLMLVRDRLGLKPLYYAWTRDGLLFASELKSFLAWPDVPRAIDREAVLHYFTLGYVPHPYSIYESIRHLPPGSQLVVEGQRLSINRYWRLSSTIDRSRTREEAVHEVRELVRDAVARRMVSDVPLGVFLSGGLDSSIVAAMMAQQSSRPVQSFFIDFEERNHSEQRYAQAMVDRYRTDHHVLVMRPRAADMLDQLVEMFDEPFGDSSAVPSYHLAQAARRYVTVVLSGDGGDESFAGYRRYFRMLSRRKVHGLLRGLARPLARRLGRRMSDSARGSRYLRAWGLSDEEFFAVELYEEEARRWLEPDFLSGVPERVTFSLLRPDMSAADQQDPLARFTRLDLHRYLPDDILTKVDRTSMAVSLEVRDPLLDYRVVELAASLPTEWKVDHHGGKSILKQAFANDLPAVILEARKQGFSLPLGEWFRGELREVLREALADQQLAQAGILRIPALEQVAQQHWSGRRNNAMELWRILVFIHWWRRQASASIPAAS